jgi:hypothetical protein
MSEAWIVRVVSEAERSELAGAVSDREAGIPPSSERDPATRERASNQ